VDLAAALGDQAAPLRVTYRQCVFVASGP
jgi:hypothetical protein